MQSMQAPDFYNENGNNQLCCWCEVPHLAAADVGYLAGYKPAWQSTGGVYEGTGA